MYLLYDFILTVSALALIPWYLLRGVKYGKVRRGVRERLGFFAPQRLAPLEGRPVIWVHAVSVGETRAAIPLIKGLRREYPGHAIVLSNVTETGHAVAGGIAEVDLCLFFPFDLSWVVRRVLRQVKPALIVIVETEIWPNFVQESKRAAIPLVLVNGRISDRSYPRYRFVGVLLRPILEAFSVLCMQTEQDAARIRSLGAPQQRVQVTGNLKFDMKAPQTDGEPIELRDRFRLPGDAVVWVAGSTHAGEEEIITSVYRQMLAAGHALVLVLVPRHPERCRMVGEMLDQASLPYTLRSALPQRQRDLEVGEVLLVDTLGEMLPLYTASDLVVVGGSFVTVGGHNVLEAALVSKPVLFGPHMSNFREIARLLLEAGGGRQVADATELAAVVKELLLDRDRARAMGERGYALLAGNAGATERTLEAIGCTLQGRG